MYQNLAILCAFIFVYSVLSKGLERTPINGAVVFAAFGLAVGPFGLNLLKMDIDAEGLRTLAELTLAFVLFADASNADLGVLKKTFRIPQRMLVIGLPLTILLGFGAGVFLFDTLTLFEVAILATLLAPTDAALGKAVVTNESVPDNLRQALSVESGFNDGICVPVLFVFLALASGSNTEDSTSMLALKLVAEEIGIGLAVGAGLTIIGVLLLKGTHRLGWITETWRQLPVAALAVGCFCLAQALGGSGFIAAFAGGLLFGAMAKDHKHGLLLAAEGTGDTFSLLTWVVFGAGVVPLAFDHFNWKVLLYALLSLTVIRMLPVFLALRGRGLRTDEKLFAGWFGPRGLASVVFAVIVFNKDLPGGNIIVITAVYTVMLSVLLHGLSANPLVGVLKARIAGSQGQDTVDR